MNKLFPIVLALLFFSCINIDYHSMESAYGKQELAYNKKHKKIYDEAEAYIDSFGEDSGLPLIFRVAGADYEDPFVRFEVLTGRDIKYLNLDVSFYNQVGDKVRGSYYDDNFNTKLNRIVGAFKKGDIKSKRWTGMTNNEIHCMKIDSIGITYMDGGFDNYSGDEVNQFILPQEKRQKIGKYCEPLRNSLECEDAYRPIYDSLLNECCRYTPKDTIVFKPPLYCE